MAVHKLPQLNIDEALKTIAHPLPDKPRPAQRKGKTASAAVEAHAKAGPQVRRLARLRFLPQGAGAWLPVQPVENEQPRPRLCRPVDAGGV